LEKLAQWTNDFQLKNFNKTTPWVYANKFIIKSGVVFVFDMNPDIIGNGDSPLYVEHS